MPNRSTFSRDLQANETVADWLDALGIDPTSYQPADATLTALAAYNTNGLVAQTAADAFAGRSIAVSGTGLGVSNADGVSGNPTITITPSAVVGAVGTIPAAAAQSDQETASSTTTYVSPGRQQFHPSAPKCWAYVTVATGTPTLAASYNITSITDTGQGVLTITIATDFSSATWCAQASIERDNDNTDDSDSRVANIKNGSIAAGSVALTCAALVVTGLGAGTFNTQDPSSWHFVGYGDQA